MSLARAAGGTSTGVANAGAAATAPVAVRRRVAITGAHGFLGWHLRCAIAMRPGFEAVAIGRADFDDPQRLIGALTGTDAVVHLAGVSRGPQDEVESGNPRITRVLVDALRGAGIAPHVLFANSTHSRDLADAPPEALTPYGRAKRECTAILGEWASACGARYTDVRLPHLFGECGKPFYNSAIATFCHQLAHGDTPKIGVNGIVELLHAQRACDLVLDAIDSGHCGPLSPLGERMRASEALDRLLAMHAIYADGTLPRFDTPLDLDLFNTLRSFRFPQHYPVGLDWRSDQRGRLFEAVKTVNGGQCFASWTNPGFVRGNHYHRRKIERFLVASGSATIRIRRLMSSEVHAFEVDGNRPVFIDMPTLHTHNITNTGSGELVTLFWSHEIFDPAAPDTYSEAV